MAGPSNTTGVSGVIREAMLGKKTPKKTTKPKGDQPWKK